MSENNYPIANQFTIPAALKRAYAHWNAGQAPEAEQFCQQILQAVPHQPDALHLLGVMAHACGRFELAIGYLRKACLFPSVPAAYSSNLAEMCRQQGLLMEAEQAARRAVTQEPQLVAGWNNLGIILQESGQLDASLDCLQRVVALQPGNHEAHNNLANTYKLLGRSDEAQASYRQALALHPDYAEAHSNLAFLLNDQGRFDEAAAAARRAIDIQPHLTDAYLNLAEIETSRNRYTEAMRWLDAAMSFAPRHVSVLTARAQVLIKSERLHEALACAREAAALAPDNARAHNVLGTAAQVLEQHELALACFDRAAALPGTVEEDALVARAVLFMEMGRKDDAVAAFDLVLQHFPGSTRAMTARTDSKIYRREDPDIAVMEAALARALKSPIGEQISLHFALGKAYLDTGDSARAFFHLDNGNAIKRGTYTYDAVQTSTWMRKIAAAFTPARMEKFRHAGVVSERVVFIIGMPRSGTTLVEQILASHPGIYGAGELSTLRHAVERCGSFPDDLAYWSAEDYARIGRDYLADVDRLAPGALRLIDKMPGNFIYAGLIPLILSGARIIHCRRDPIDTCLSCYSKHFAGEQPFAYRVDELGAFHRDYQTLMDSLRPVLPHDRFLEVDYESVVDDLETQARRLIDFVGMPWDSACLNFHQTRRVVRTASVSQVRQPIYATSKGRWHRHAAHLGPLLDALGVARPIPQ